MTKQKITADQLIRKIQSAGFEARAYSGRGMYGKYCVGCDVGEYDELPYALTSVAGYHTDSMGRGTILYWPHIAAPEEL
jgi:hypothetical protein